MSAVDLLRMMGAWAARGGHGDPGRWSCGSIWREPLSSPFQHRKEQQGLDWEMGPVDCCDEGPSPACVRSRVKVHVNICPGQHWEMFAARS